MPRDPVIVPTLQAVFSQPAKAFPHFWEHTVGSGHAPLALRADWQTQMPLCHDELGFQHVPFSRPQDELFTLGQEWLIVAPDLIASAHGSVQLPTQPRGE